MADTPETPEKVETPEDVESSETPVISSPIKKIRNTALIALLFVILVPLVVFALWVWIALGYSYASGERAGYI